MKRVILSLAVLLFPVSLLANQAYNGSCRLGAQPVVVSTFPTRPTVEASYPSCTVSVYITGSGGTLATIYSDNSRTPLSNPFTANANGSFQFFAANGMYDVTLSGSGFSAPITIYSNNLFDYNAPVPQLYTEWFADQYLSGSSTAGIQEAYSACQAATATNAYGCKVVYGSDVLTAAGGTVTLHSTYPLFIDMRGHAANLTCTTGVCLTFFDNPGGGSRVVIEHGAIHYSGSAATSIKGVVELSGLDFVALRDLSISPTAKVYPTALLIVNDSDDGFIENCVFAHGTNPIIFTDSPTWEIIGGQISANNGPILVNGPGGGETFQGVEIFGNTGATVFDVEALNGNVNNIKFVAGGFAVNTGSTAQVYFNTGSSGNVIENVSFDGVGFGAPGGGSTGVVFKFNGAVPNLNFKMLGNSYNGPFAALESGWVAGQNTISDSDQLAGDGWTPSSFGDVIINGSPGVGTVTVNGQLIMPQSSVTQSLTWNYNSGAGTAKVGISRSNGNYSVADASNGTLFSVDNNSAPKAAHTGRLIYDKQTGVSIGSGNTCGVDFAFSSGWNTPTSCEVRGGSKDQAGNIMFISGGSPTANPYITLTFHDGPFVNPPFCIGSFAVAAATSSLAYSVPDTAGSAKFIYSGTPPGSTYIQFTWACWSGG